MTDTITGDLTKGGKIIGGQPAIRREIAKWIGKDLIEMVSDGKIVPIIDGIELPVGLNYHVIVTANDVKIGDPQTYTVRRIKRGGFSDTPQGRATNLLLADLEEKVLFAAMWDAHVDDWMTQTI